MLAKQNRAQEVLERVPWAQNLLRRARERPNEQGLGFELRVAHELHLAGVEPQYEFATGVGGSSVDFRLPGRWPWNLELVSARISDAVKDATVQEDVGSGLIVQTIALGFDHQREADVRQTPERDLLRLQHVVLSKVWEGTAPTKFPVGTDALNVILIDVRAFLGGTGDVDRDDLLQLAYGPSRVTSPANVAYHPQTGAPIRGIFDPENDGEGARTARERVHALACVHEMEFTDDEIRQTLVLFANPSLADSSQLRHFPLRWNAESEAPLRRQNPLWVSG
jgi:hypothetical protein